LGLEFLPHLEEGNLWIRATMPPSISLEEGNDFVNRMRLAIKSFPEIETVVSQQGRPDDGTDATGFFNAEFFAPLKPTKEWRKGVSKEKLIEEVNETLEAQFPGVSFNFSQYIQDNVEEAVSGVKGENSVKLIGNDLVIADRDGGENQGRDEQGTRRGRSRGVHLARPADAADRYRSQGSRALRARARRHQCGGSDRGRRASGRRPLRGGKRPAFPVGRSARTEIPGDHRDDQRFDDRRAGSSDEQGRADTAHRGGNHEPGIGPRLHLPRATAALYSDQIQRARARPRQHGAGGTAQDCG
jgi:AcrB/AcrD/AcrF family